MIRVAGCACCRHYASAWICQLRERRVARTASQGGKLRQDLHSIDCSTLQQVASATIHTTPQSRTPGNADENCDPPALRSRHRPRASVPRTAAEQLRPYIRRPARVACEECAAENTRDTSFLRSEHSAGAARALTGSGTHNFIRTSAPCRHRQPRRCPARRVRSPSCMSLGLHAPGHLPATLYMKRCLTTPLYLLSSSSQPSLRARCVISS